MQYSKAKFAKTRNEDLSHVLPESRIFTLKEWIDWVEANPNHVKEIVGNTPTKIALLTASISTVTRNLERQLKPFSVLEQRLSHENILSLQKTELKYLYEQCLSAKDFTYQDENERKYKLVNSLIFSLELSGPKILIPPSLVGPLLALTHLQTGHSGKVKMKAALENYTFDRKNASIENFITKCYPCMLVNKSTTPNKIGQYPIASYPFETLYCDIAEHLGKSGNYEHILVTVCTFSEAVYLFPLKSKTSEAIYHAIIYGVLQHYNVKAIFFR